MHPWARQRAAAMPLTVESDGVEEVDQVVPGVGDGVLLAGRVVAAAAAVQVVVQVRTVCEPCRGGQALHW